MAKTKKRVSLLTSAATNGNARPHFQERRAPARLIALQSPQRAKPMLGAPAAPDFLIWQLVDSAFPTGGFAHSSGLEAAWQHGEVRGRTELVSFIEASLDQLGHAGLPFVLAAFDAPEKLAEFDALCDAFTTNHVANRASRAQGRAFLAAVAARGIRAETARARIFFMNGPFGY